jgi:secreted trypsin-like serine protease
MVLKVDNLWKMVGIVSAALAQPVIFKNRIVNICDLNYYLVFTDVSKYYDWVYQIVLSTP